MTLQDYDRNLTPLFNKYRGSHDNAGIAYELMDSFAHSGEPYMLGVIAFCAGGRNRLTVFDTEGTAHLHVRHTVLCVNDMVIDPVHGFPAMSMLEYIARLVLCQPHTSGVCVHLPLSSSDFGVYSVRSALKEEPSRNSIHDRRCGLTDVPISLFYQDVDVIDRLHDYICKFQDKAPYVVSKMVEALVIYGMLLLLSAGETPEDTNM